MRLIEGLTGNSFPFLHLMPELHSFYSATSVIQEEYYKTVLKALNLYNQNPSGWNLIIKNCMNYNFGWDFNNIEKYNNIYEEILY